MNKELIQKELERKEKKMIKADEMFEKLGYVKVNIGDMIIYKKDGHEICFYLYKNNFDCGCGIGREIITMQELQAINQKCKELRVDRLSEEEIIEIIKDFLELREIHSSDSMTKSYLSVYKEAIQSLLDLYNKEKEKNKELFLQYEKEVDRLEYQITTMISKDKIREKIKIRKEEKAECTDSIEASFLLREIYVLQELLEEE